MTFYLYRNIFLIGLKLLVDLTIAWVELTLMARNMFSLIFDSPLVILQIKLVIKKISIVKFFIITDWTTIVNRGRRLMWIKSGGLFVAKSNHLGRTCDISKWIIVIIAFYKWMKCPLLKQNGKVTCWSLRNYIPSIFKNPRYWKLL